MGGVYVAAGERKQQGLGAPLGRQGILQRAELAFPRRRVGKVGGDLDQRVGALRVGGQEIRLKPARREYVTRLSSASL